MIYRAERGSQLFFNVVWGIVNLFTKTGLPYLSPVKCLQSTKNLSTGACKLALQRQTCQCSSPPWFGLILYRKMSTGGLEPPQISPHAPQACASTIPPRRQIITYSIFNLSLWRNGRHMN